jgi:DNA-binding MarR family transcriptional regulator
LQIAVGLIAEGACQPPAERQRLTQALATIAEQRQLKAAGSSAGLGSASWQLLSALAEIGPAGVSELATKLERDERASVSRALARLRGAGLVRLAPDGGSGAARGMRATSRTN